jgi:hypothetical protein
MGEAVRASFVPMLRPSHEHMSDDLSTARPRGKASLAARYRTCWGWPALAGLFIIRSISGPPVCRKRQTSYPASARNTMLSNAV